MKRIGMLALLILAYVCGSAATLPFEFKYDGKQYRGTEGRIDDNLTVRVERATHPDFSESEYTVWFENTGNAPTKVLEDVYAIKTEFAGANPVLRGCLGDHRNYYKNYENDLSKGAVDFRSTNGRATHIVFPYFDLVHGNGGTRIALGWAGTWEAHFEARGAKTIVAARTNLGLRTVLMPGEKVRTGLVVLMDYSGREEHISINQWRAWFMKYNLPKADGQGNDLKPFWTTCLAADTGLPNSDGSISETYFTWQRTLTVMEREHLVPDFRWFDAGWYCDPQGNSVPSNWWGTVGTWELDKKKWPGKTFRESNEACHALGMKTLVWFEPERVTDVENLCKNYGYKVEWGVKTDDWTISNNIGDPECLKWTLDRIIKMMDENEVDLFREDNNSDPAAAWKILDTRDSVKYGVPRKGINENKCIQGHYALWDGILQYCRTHGKCGFLDSCASGGGRNDIESMRRGVPFMRSDADRTTTAMRLAQSSGFNKWVPFHGANTKETKYELEASEKTPDMYVVRVSLLPIWNMGEAYSHNLNLDLEGYRRNLAVWKKYNHLLVKDFYHLSEYHGPKDTSGWTVFAYNDPKAQEGIVTAFRQETCQQPTYSIKLPFAVKGKTYRVTNTDTGETVEIAGAKLQAGYTLSLAEPRSSLLLEIRPK